MASTSTHILKLIRPCGKSLTAQRNTWVLHRVYAPEVTPEGAVQRNPSELPNLQKLAVTEYETNRKAGPIKVILLKDVEGVGHQFDVVEVDRKYARTDLLLSKKAVYASPFDLEYYAEMKEKMADELAARIRIPFELLSIGRELQKLVVPIKVSMENAWKLNNKIIKASLRQIGVDVLDDSIYLPEPTINGPNFEMEAKLLRFYVVVSNSYIVPMIGKISHISVDESKKIISPESQRAPIAADLNKHGIKKEEPVYSKTSEFTADFPVVDFMQQKLRNS